MNIADIPLEWRLDAELLANGGPPALAETIFSLSNGYFGCRGSAPFAPRGTRGTYVNGLYARAPSAIAWIPPVTSRSRDSERFPDDESIQRCGKEWALVVAPNVFFWEAAEEQPVRIIAMTPALDMQHGIMHFEGKVAVAELRLHFSATRFLDRTNRHRAYERIRITEAFGRDFVVYCGIDATVRTWRNRNAFDLWESREFTVDQDMIGWRGVTRGHYMDCALACACTARRGSAELRCGTGEAPGWRISGSGDVLIERFVTVSSSSVDSEPVGTVLSECKRAAAAGYENARQRQSAAWEALWRRGDIRIEGPVEDQQAVRYALFQTMSSVSGLSHLSIGAKFLSHEGYVGGVYWDMDIFVLPYLIRSFPEHARNHLLFRYAGLAAAKKKARRYGYRGALYAWSSLPGGEEATAPWLVIDRTQLHIVAAVAWGVVEYVRWTDDRDFLHKYGGEMLAETARFWAAKIDSDGSIRAVCGPDEACPRVDNNAYTNRMAAANLRWAAEYVENGVSAEERQAWRKAADAIVQQKAHENGIIEQFDGYFASPELQRAKQADVLMLPVVFPDLLSSEQIAANFRYYEPRCAHGSSLSEGAYALAAARAGFVDEAYKLFRKCLFMDLWNMHGNTANGGLHAGCAGFAATVIAQGFCGLHLTKDGPAFDIRLPEPWRSVSFRFWVRGREYTGP